jgi:acetoin utilization protein AcuB
MALGDKHEGEQFVGCPREAMSAVHTDRVGRVLALFQRMSELIIERFMTHSPHTIGEEQPLSIAHQLMREHGIRHLPVLHGGKLVGMLSQRDLHFIETLANVDPDTVSVSEAMSTDTYVVGPRATLSKVAEEMADRRYGSVVVMDKERVVGILTTVDGMRALSVILSELRQEAGPRASTP